jgi:hypothetical protein
LSTYSFSLNNVEHDWRIFFCDKRLIRQHALRTLKSSQAVLQGNSEGCFRGMLLRQHAWAIRHRCFISAAQSCVAFSFQSTPHSNEKKCTSSVAEGCIPSATPACTLLPLLLPAYRSFASQAEASQQAVQGAALAPITNGAAVSTIPEQYTRLERITGRYRVHSISGEHPVVSLVAAHKLDFKLLSLCEPRDR